MFGFGRAPEIVDSSSDTFFFDSCLASGFSFVLCPESCLLQPSQLYSTLTNHIAGLPGGGWWGRREFSDDLIKPQT